jgi:hypothetical protein
VHCQQLNSILFNGHNLDVEIAYHDNLSLRMISYPQNIRLEATDHICNIEQAQEQGQERRSADQLQVERKTAFLRALFTFAILLSVSLRNPKSERLHGTNAGLASRCMYVCRNQMKKAMDGTSVLSSFSW